MRIRTAGRRVIEFICQIRVRGHLGETIRSGFPALRARTEGEDTVLSGVLADQAALYGVLAQCEALGLELLDVRRLDQTDDESQRSDDVQSPTVRRSSSGGPGIEPGSGLAPGDGAGAGQEEEGEGHSDR